MKVWVIAVLGMAMLPAATHAQQVQPPAAPPPAETTPASVAAPIPPPAQPGAVRTIRPAAAPNTPAVTPEQRSFRFDVLDIDKNGQLTKEEWLPSIPDQMKDYADQIWAMMDTGSKSFVTREQFVGFRPQRPV
jgi:hypothetical protein